MTGSRRAAVIGAGVTGLAAAWRLRLTGFDVVLFDAADRCGGRVDAAEFSGRLVDTGPDSLGPDPAMDELLRQIGMADQVEVPNPPQAFRLTEAGHLDPFGLGGGAMYGLSGGIASLVARLEQELEGRGAEFRLRTRIEKVEVREGAAFLSAGAEESFDIAFIATGARAAANLIGGPAGEALAGISRLSVTLVHLAIPAGRIGREMNGTGYLADPAEGRLVTGCSWSSAKWKRLRGEPVILRASVREVGQGEVIGLSDEEVVTRVMAELAPVMEIEGDPVETMVTRHPDALVVRDESLSAAVATARSALSETPEICLVGADLDGPGISRSIGAVRKTVDTIIEGNSND